MAPRTLLLLAALLSQRAAAQQGPSDLEKANALFQAGKFAEAGKVYAEDPKNYPATVRLGSIALLSNRLDEAQKWLEKAVALKPEDTAAKVLLAEVFYRRDEFQKAAPLLRAAGQEAKAKKLESFKGTIPYQVQGQAESTTVKFLKTDPLPLVQVRVGGKEATFFLDTGVSEVLLDTEFARELGVKQFGAEQGTFSGGKHAAVQHGRLDSLTLGDWTIKEVPVGIINTRQFSKDLGVKQVDGALGTVLFYHFLTTLDYPKGELVLRRKTPENLKRLEQAQAGKAVVVPFWMADDHFMVARGRIDKREPVLLFVDTGLVGGAVKLAEAVIKEAGIKLLEDQATEGVGGAGKIRIVPFTLRELSLGEIKEQDVKGVFDGPFPWENAFGFRLAGMVGHDFFRPYALTLDFTGMRLLLQRK